MKLHIHHHVLLLLLLMTLLAACKANDFVVCMISTSTASATSQAFNYLHSPGSPSYSRLLHSAQQNPRWLNSTAPPLFIISPYTPAEIRAAIICSRRHDLLIRVKSGGHDYEGLSYAYRRKTQSPHFVILDLLHFRSITIHLEDDDTAAYAWVQSGATLGELYYSIARESSAHGFPAGLCPSVGVGGHFSGGGFGTLLRKHGLAADNILDAYMMDVNGNIMNRELMGEDLFWAIRGGGGASFGVILSWKIKLVPVPPAVTVFTIHKNLQDHETIRLIHKWQHISSNKLPQDLFIRIVIQRINGGISEALFNSLFLGPVADLIPLMNKSFPELGLHLQEKEYIEMSWIESVLYFAGLDRGDPLQVLLNRTVQYRSSFKAKSDFVERPIPEAGLQGIREWLLAEVDEEGATSSAFVIMDPFGGRMEEIPAWELPFPHRGGNLFNVQYIVKWIGESESSSRKHIKWMNEVYKYMKPYVSSSPRAAYVNYRDLDLGVNSCNTSSSSFYDWGRKYFKGNLERLRRVKKRVDPGNFFRNEQSIPLPP